MKKSLCLVVSVIGLSTSVVGCVMETTESEDGSENAVEATQASGESGEHLAEATEALRVGTYYWGFTDCTNHADSQALASIFTALGLGFSSAAGKLPGPFMQLVGTGVSAGYWGWLAASYTAADTAPGSKGVCVDWYWIPVIKSIYTWK